jgi:hypothetical protein
MEFSMAEHEKGDCLIEVLLYMVIRYYKEHYDHEHFT